MPDERPIESFTKRVPWRRVLLVATIASAALAAIAIGAHARHNASVDARPVRVALPFAETATVRAEFVTDRDAYYEIEVDVLLALPPDVLARYIEPLEDDSPLPVSWRVLDASGGVVALGGSAEALYLSAGGTTLQGRLKRWITAVPFHRIAGGTMQRGVGKFRGAADARYTIEASVETPAPELTAGDPHIAVRLSRTDWKRHYEEKLPAFRAGVGLAVSSVLCGALWLVATVRRRSKG